VQLITQSGEKTNVYNFFPQLLPPTISGVSQRGVMNGSMKSPGSMPLHALLAVLLAGILAGSDQLNQQTQQKPSAPSAPSAPKAKANRVAVHRFVLTKYDGSVAFDSQTGQICKTWEWQATGKQEKPDPLTGGVPPRAFGEYTPTCLSLYQQYPSGTDSGAEIIDDSTPAGP
jgi:hypothetical protein